MQHAIERIERPGGSHEGVGRKKILNPEPKRKMTTIRISFPKLIMPKTATYNQCYLVQAAKKIILRTSMERIKGGKFK